MNDDREPDANQESQEDSGNRSKPGSVGGQSVLLEIERLIGTKFRVKLKDLADETGPDVALAEVDLPIRDLGRYQTIGEIARGGVGVVVRCRDLDLGRDVAMKVIRDEHTGNQVTLKRFVEEAQVGGQLQHPGVVPVYELGLREDGRPYFTMKLIKGKTLSALLTDRDDPKDDLRRFLVIFEGICQTLAFAHARGVVHRDLKPANILVGSFGEVQVSDWGFAKVLRGGGVEDERRALESRISVIETVRTLGTGSDSLAGSVMGTPAYMSPEQALGDVDRLDERSDVFSLGALLVEILTGLPPFTGRTTEEVLMKAARHEIGEAEERLRSSGADKKLVDLALLCMNQKRKKRPQNAKVLANAIGAYLASVEKRIKNAQVITAKAQVQAEGERKARRLTVGLAAVVFLVVLLGAGGASWMIGKRIAAEEEQSRRVAVATEDAGRLATEARQSGDLGKWGKAEETAAYALRLATDGEISPERRARITALTNSVRAEAAAARRLAERKRTNADLVARLRRIRTGGTDATGHRGIDESYAAAFRAAGIDVDQLSPLETAERIRQDGLADEVAAVLDTWAISRKEASPDARAEWMKLIEIARTVDPDEGRNRFRDAWVEGSSGEITALAMDVAPGEFDPHTLSLLGNALGHQGVVARPLDLLRAGVKVAPGDFWLHAWLAFWLASEGDFAAAVDHYTAAVAIQPKSAGTWNNLALAYGELGDRDSELEALDKAIEIDPSFSRALYNRGLVLRELGRMDDAVKSLEKAVLARDDYALAWRVLGSLLREMKNITRAGYAFQKSIDLESGSRLERVETLKRIGQLRTEEGKLREAKAYFEQATAIEATDAEAHVLLGDTLWSQSDFARAIDSYRTATQVDEDYDLGYRKLISAYVENDELEKHVEQWEALVRDDASAWRYWYLLGLAYERQEDRIRAIDCYRKVTQLHGGSGWTWYALANAYRQVSAFTEAVKAYERAAALVRDDPGILNDLGATHHRLGRPEQAIRAYRNAIRIGPRDAQAHYNLGFIYIEWGRVTEGLQSLKTALDIDPNHALALASYVGTLCGRGQPGDFGRAAGAASRALEWDKTDENAPALLGTAFGYRKSLEVARARLAKVLIDPTDEAVSGYWNNFAVARFRCGDAKTAVDAWRIARARLPADKITIKNLARGLRALGDYEGAIDECLLAIKADPEFVGAYEAMAETLNALGDNDKAVETWELAYNLDPAIDRPRLALINALFRRGTDADYDRVVAMVREVAREHPLRTDLQYQLGQSLGWKGDDEAALALHDEEFPTANVTSRVQFRSGLAYGLLQRGWFTQSLTHAVEAARLQPENANHHAMVARVLARTHPFAEAVERHAELFPERGASVRRQFFASLAGSYYLQLRYEDALPAYLEYLKRLSPRAPARPSAHYSVSVTLRLLLRHEEAIEHVKKAIRLLSSTAWPARALAEIHMDMGNLRAAAEELAGAMRIHRNAPYPNYWLGIVQLHLGDFEEARDQLQRGRLLMGAIERGAWWMAQSERMIELMPRRSAILTGTATVGEAQDAIDYARFASYCGYPMQAVAWYERAFEMDPALAGDLVEGHRYAAVRQAMRVGAGHGPVAETLGAEKRAQWRARALAWMGEELAAWRRQFAENRFWYYAEAYRFNHGRWDHPTAWHLDPAMAFVARPRESEATPAAEREAWGTLFADVQAFVRESASIRKRE